MEEYLKSHERLARLFDREIVFIAGAIRWGTAWVQQCLDAHPEICCKGEGHFTDVLFPMLAKVFDDYNAEAETVGNRLQKAELPGNAAGFTFEDVDHMMTTAIGLALDRWTDGADVKVIAEKTPEHVVSLDLLARVVPSLKIVHVYRDGRDEAVSAWEFNSGLSRGKFREQYPKFGDFAKTFAGNWSKSITAAQRLSATTRDSVFISAPKMPRARRCRCLGVVEIPRRRRQRGGDQGHRRSRLGGGAIGRRPRRLETHLRGGGKAVLQPPMRRVAEASGVRGLGHIKFEWNHSDLVGSGCGVKPQPAAQRA